jgi:N-acyl-D-amino-acid deacylase
VSARWLTGLACLALGTADAHAAVLITNAVIIDGTGTPSQPGSVRIDGDRIVAVGALETTPADTVVDAHGLVLAPGFIDTHSHHDRDLFELRDAPAAVSQGVTTIVVGNDGDSSLPVRDFFAALEQTPVSLNVASYTGHGSLRKRVLGDNFRHVAKRREQDEMQKLLEQDLDAGSLGLSTGLEYEPGAWSDTDELVQLAEVASRHGGRYISHIRSEDYKFDEAIDEILAIGRRAHLPVQVSHIKMAMRGRWGDAPKVIKLLESARAQGVDVTADVYPYDAWQSTLKVLFPKHDYTNRASATFALQNVAAPEDLTISRFAPEPALVGMTLRAIADKRGTDPEMTLMDLIAESQVYPAKDRERVESVIGRSMKEPDIAAFIAWPYSNICSDGELQSHHPRGAGAFTRVLRVYVREQKLLTLEQAVHKMTGLSAQHVGIADRGVIKPGAYADLVLFDPATVSDHSTFEAPQSLSTGVARVWVNGQVVLEDGRTTGTHSGQVVRRAAAK